MAVFITVRVDASCMDVSFENLSVLNTLKISLSFRCKNPDFWRINISRSLYTYFKD